MNKESLRNKYRHLRSELSQEEISKKSEAITNQIVTLPIWEASYFSLFLSIEKNKEVDTRFILTMLQAYDKEICLPKVVADQQLSHYLLTDNTLIKTNNWQIPEPQNGLEVPINNIEVVFVPLLAFDQRGHRLGYGKGYYDRFLSQCRSNIITIGLSFFEAELHHLPTEATDIPLNYCVTPEKVYAF